MNDLQIDYFMAVATNLSFTKASEELFVSQPAISKQISLLERELGAKLFKRNNQRTELTEVGRLYYEFFSRYRTDLINTKLEADRILGKDKALIRVGFLEGWDLFGIIPAMMKEYKAIYPDSDIIINCCGIKDLSSALLKDSIDLIVTMKNSVNMYSEFECHDAARIGKILLYSAMHPLAARPKEELSLRDFRNDVFMAPWGIVENFITEAVAAYTRPYGFIPELRFVKNHESTITCVRNNMGVAIADQWVWAKDSEDLKWIGFDALDTITVARMRSKHSENVLNMEKILIDVIKKQESTK